MSEWEYRLGGKKDPPGHEAGQRYRYRSLRGGGEVSYAYPGQQPARQKTTELSNLSIHSFISYPSVQSTHTLRSTKDEDHCPEEHRSSTASRYKQQFGSLQPISTAPPPRREFAGPFADQNDQLEPISTAPPPRREFAGPFADQNDQLEPISTAPPPRREFAGPFADQNDQLEPISTAPPPRREFAGPFADQNDQLIVGSLSSPVGSTVDSGYPSLEFTDSCSGSSNVSWAEEEKPPARIRPLAPPPQKQHPHCLPRYKTIEVAPGQHLRLRGADETTQAIQDDFYIPCECSCCTKTILCIQDADYVLCPDCRVVSPIREQLENDKSNGGVGLGFKVESLFPDSAF